MLYGIFLDSPWANLDAWWHKNEESTSDVPFGIKR